MPILHDMARWTEGGCQSVGLRTIHKELESSDCLHCGAKFTTRQCMNKHIAAVHEEKKQFMCSFCNGNECCTLISLKFMKERTPINAQFVNTAVQEKLN